MIKNGERMNCGLRKLDAGQWLFTMRRMIDTCENWKKKKRENIIKKISQFVLRNVWGTVSTSNN